MLARMDIDILLMITPASAETYRASSIRDSLHMADLMSQVHQFTGCLSELVESCQAKTHLLASFQVSINSQSMTVLLQLATAPA